MNIVCRLVVLALPFVIGTVACSSPAEDSASTSTPISENDGGKTLDSTPAPKPAPDFCKSYCEKVHACDQSIDADTCENQCDNTNAATLPKYREDVVETITTCVEEKDCKTILANQAVSKCVSEASASIAPSDATTSACAALATSSTKCKATFDRAECLETGKLFNDDALATVEKCAQKACTDVDECVEAAVGSNLGRTAAPQCSSVGDGKWLDSPSAACDSCMGSSCCAESNACATSTSCSSLVDCISACSTDTCVDNCAYYHSSGVSAFNALVDCMGSRCSAACE